MDWDSFFIVHKDLPREGPGCAADVHWACAVANVPVDGSVCDAGCGPGGDFAALLAAVPSGTLVGVDMVERFVSEAKARFGNDPRVQVFARDMAELADLETAPFDLIWCAGALYFLGVPKGLSAFKPALKPGGAVAFSYPCYFTDTPSDQAKAMWGEDGELVLIEDQLLAQVRDTGYEILGHQPVPDEAWEEYYQPQDARVASLRPDASPELTAMLDACDAEAAAWRAAKTETGYMLIVARPV